MPDIEQLDDLLAKTENDSVEFKREQYQLESEEGKSRFIKDVISMANTPRSASAYIIVGAETKNGRVVRLQTVTDHPDPATFQDTVAAKVSPMPRFAYRVVEHKGSTLGIFEIFPERSVPVVPRTRFGVLHKGVVYFRRDGQNVEADSQEIARIVAWSHGPSSQPRDETNAGGSWEELLEACDGFGRDRVYVAVIEASPGMSDEDWAAFGGMGWNLVIDFDSGTDASGAYIKTSPVLCSSRSLRLNTLEGGDSTIRPSTTVWVAALGVTSRPSTLATKGWREWNRTKSRAMERLIANLSSATEPQPVTVLVFGGEPVFVQSICDMVDQAFGDRAQFVVAHPSTSSYTQIAEKFEAKIVSTNLIEVAQGLSEMRSDASLPVDVRFPKLDGGTVAIAPDRARWLEEELELLHASSGLSAADPDSERRDFLRGFQITWHGLSLHVDVDRALTPTLLELVRRRMDSRETVRAALWHAPGGGGTTVARRVAWEIHDQFPAVLTTTVSADRITERLRFLFACTRLPVLLVVDSATATAEEMDRLYDQLRTENIAAAILQVKRRSREPSGSGHYLPAPLTNREASALAHSLAYQVPGRRDALLLLSSSEDRLRRTPFYFGLTAFGKDFAGLEPYVKARLDNASDVAKTVARLSALVYHFGQQAIAMGFFTPLVKLPASKLVYASQVVPEYALELFVSFHGSIRPAHELIAAEILEQLLSANTGDRRNWRLALADTAIELIDLLAQQQHGENGMTIRLLRTVLIERGTDDTIAGPWEGQFSPLLFEIPSTEGQQRVLEHLTEAFPNEPHFWAHLGRFYSRVIKDHSKARDAHSRSIELEPHDDSVLYHMAGMAWRTCLYDDLETIRPGELDRLKEDEVRHLVNEAKSAFAKAREIDARSEYNYISDIQMIERLVGRVAPLKGFGHDTAGFLIARGQDWYRELIDDAENLFAELRLVRSSESPSRYDEQTRLRLDQLYGDYSKVIEGWTNLLTSQDVYKPPIRRAVIRAYVSRRGDDWQQLTPRELSRISELARQNLEEEPASDANLRFWFRAVRLTGEAAVERVAEQLSYRRIQHPTIDTLYYLYILKFLQVEEGVNAMLRECREILEECRQAARYSPQRTRRFEWLGTGTGLQSLVHLSSLGEWDNAKKFWSNHALLRRIPGHIARIDTQGAGQVELAMGLRAFFVPSAGLVADGYLAERDIGRKVEFYLAFRYDGLEAWSVGDTISA